MFGELLLEVVYMAATLMVNSAVLIAKGNIMAAALCTNRAAASVCERSTLESPSGRMPLALWPEAA